MKGPRFGETNVGALLGAIVGSLGGLFAVGLARAILAHDITLILEAHLLGLCGWLIAGLVGWVLGGQLGPRLGMLLHQPRAEIVGGILGGMVPVVLIALWGWYMVAGG
ncbi:membrane hypothetical protein [Verrucomicrobia bacterium]|nr:membrane hypothetical protein [Verrucomicrobiota bacterium]